MLKRSTSRAGMFAGAVTLALAAPAHAAVVEWQAGPVSVAGGQAAQVAIGNPDIFPCRVGIQVFASPASAPVSGVTTAPLRLVINTIGNPDLLPAGGVLVGFYDPNEKPGERRLVTARVRANCRDISAAQIRSGLGVTVSVHDPNEATASIVLQAAPR